MSEPTYRIQVVSNNKVIYDRGGIIHIATIKRLISGMMKENLSYVIPVISLKFTSKITGATCYLTIVRE